MLKVQVLYYQYSHLSIFLRLATFCTRVDKFNNKFSKHLIVVSANERLNWPVNDWLQSTAILTPGRTFRIGVGHRSQPSQTAAYGLRRQLAKFLLQQTNVFRVHAFRVSIVDIIDRELAAFLHSHDLSPVPGHVEGWAHTASLAGLGAIQTGDTNIWRENMQSAQYGPTERRRGESIFVIQPNQL